MSKATGGDGGRGPHAVPAVVAVLGSASLAGSSRLIEMTIDAVENGRGDQTLFVLWSRPVTYERALLVLAIAALAVVCCAGWWLVGWLRWRRALRAARPASSVGDRAASQPELMRSRPPKGGHERDRQDKRRR
jgi:hypothetical protein